MIRFDLRDLSGASLQSKVVSPSNGSAGLDEYPREQAQLGYSSLAQKTQLGFHAADIQDRQLARLIQRQAGSKRKLTPSARCP